MFYQHACETPEILIRLYQVGGFSGDSMLKHIKSSDKQGYYLDPKFWKEYRKMKKSSMKK